MRHLLWLWMGMASLAAAQTAPAASAARDAAADAAADDRLHTFQIVDGEVHLDGVRVPGAVPAALDLAGLSTPPLRYVGPGAPVIEVNGAAYVFENGRLTPIAESARAARGVFLMGDLLPEAEPMESVPDEALALVSEEVYLRDVAGEDRGLFEKLHLERTLELEARRLAEHVRATPPGPEHDGRRADLRALLSRLLTLKQQLRREEIARAQAEIDALRGMLSARDAQHDALVDARLRELVDDPAPSAP